MPPSDKFPTDFVPVSRPLAEEMGYQAAYIFGILWNYCQMESGFCSASHETIANRAGMSRRSVMDHINKLIEAGYVEDLTPDLRNAPHHLSTKKGAQILNSREKAIKESKEEAPKEEAAPEPETPQPEADRCENPAHLNGVGRQNLPSGCAKSAYLGRQNLPMNRQSQETELIEIGDKSPEVEKEKNQGTGPRWELMNEFIALTGIPLPADRSNSKYWWSQIGVIFGIVQQDSSLGKKLMKEAFERLGRENVYDPGSLVKTIRQAMAMKTNKPKVRLK